MTDLIKRAKEALETPEVLTPMKEDLARLAVAADEALRLIGWDCDDHLSPEACAALSRFRAIAEGKE